MVDRIDHFALTVRSLKSTCGFYQRMLSFRRIDAEGQPATLAFFGRQKKGYIRPARELVRI